MAPGRRSAAALLAAVALVGWEMALGSAGTPAASSATRKVDLRIHIAASARSGAPARTWRLRCAPNGGNWPSIGPACRRLTAQLLSPITIETRDYTRITSQPVRLSGRAFGKTVALRFPAMGSGTRRSRLAQLRAALGTRAFSEAARRSR